MTLITDLILVFRKKTDEEKALDSVRKKTKAFKWKGPRTQSSILTYWCSKTGTWKVKDLKEGAHA